MKRHTLFFILLCIAQLCFSQLPQLIDFEVDTGYVTSEPEFTDNDTDYFTRTDGSNVSTTVDIMNVQGSYFFAVQDTDGDGGADNLTLSIPNIQIGNSSGDFEVSIFIAEDDTGASQHWDANTSFSVTYDIDNALNFLPLIAVESSGPSNTFPAIDTNFDGEGDGPEITGTLTEYTATFSSNGAELDLVLNFDNLTAGGEDHRYRSNFYSRCK